MPSGIDAALAKMKTDTGPEPVRVTYNGFEAQKPQKPVVTEATIDPAAEGLEKCQKIVKEQEFKIKKVQDKIAGMPPTKKMKPEIAKEKTKLQGYQYDGNYRAALDFVRKHEEAEREKKRDAADKQDEENLVGGGLKSKKDKNAEVEASAASAKSSKKDDKKKEPLVPELGPFECDTEVAAIVQSAVEGSAEAQAKLAAGLGVTSYASEVRAEEASMVSASNEKIQAKLKRVPTREHALRTIRALLWNQPAILPIFPAVVALLDETKLKSEPGGKATNLVTEMCKAGPSGKAMPKFILPVLLDYMGTAAGGKWQVKVGTMGILKEVMKRMSEPDMCPKQLGLLMPKVMAAVRQAVGDARKEVKKEAEALLRHMGSTMASTPEIRNMADEIIGSLMDSANMERAADTLQKLANTTFMNTMDSCSFGLLFPIVHRAMRESSHEAKAKGVQIVGASVNLIADPEFLEPYVAELLPLLKECLMHPTPGIQREASKSFGSLSVGLPILCEEDIYPYLMDKLESQSIDADVSEVDRRGAAHGLAEVLLARRDLLPICLYKEIIPRITSGKSNETKAGGLALFQFLAHLGTQAFLVHLPRCLQVILDALKEESEVITKQAIEALKVLVQGYGPTYPRLLLPRLQEALFFKADEPREHAMTVFFAFCEKMAESMKFGQDFLSMEILPTWYRQSLLCSIFISRTDANYAVRRQGNLLWKEKLQSGQKAKGEIMPLLQSVLKALNTSGDATRVAAAKTCLAELTSSGDAEESLEGVEPLAAPTSGVNAGVIFAGSKDIVGVADEGGEEIPPAPLQRARILTERAGSELAKADLPGPLASYVETVVASCLLETSTRADAEAVAEAELEPIVAPKQKAASGSALAALGLTQVLDKVFDGVPDEVKKGQAAGGANTDVLVRVEDLMLMYGGGHLLLKNTTLEMRKGRRYGVVGRNGAGKTTLMSTIASGGVNQIPKHIKSLHVRPEVLVAASDLTAVQFCQQDCPDGASEESLQKALQDVGFPVEMQSKSVNQLSGGWRMKLLLASAMMRQCDILLLDEPTNHLDKASVEWLSQFLVSLNNSSLMVISHDPHFLNAVCTDIIQYSSQRTLDYYEGNFDDFRRARQITSDEEAEALLLGNETEVLGDVPVSVENDDDPSNGGVVAGLLDKSSKISFPIPGKVQGHSSNRPVMELKNVYFAYDEVSGPMVLKDVSCRLNLSSRVGIIGENGAGKSTLLNLLCGELFPSPAPGGALGEVQKNRNLRLAYIAQQHMYHLGDFMNSTACNYIQKRFKNGWDEALQERLIKPASEEEAKTRKELAAKYGKYCNEVETIESRVERHKELLYEVQWKNLPDAKQNTMETVAKLKMMGVSSFAKAYDERLAAQAIGLDQRPLSQREVVKHLEQFGLDEELVLNRQIGGFSAGQKSKLTLGAAFWTRPHMVALDEPTNYIDMETLDSLAQALQRFKGGVVVISHSSDFVERVCNETWLVEDGTIKKETKIDKKA